MSFSNERHFEKAVLPAFKAMFKAMSGDLVFAVEPDAVDTDIVDQNIGMAQVIDVDITNGTVTNDGAGNIDVTVTAEGMPNSPKTVSVAVGNDDGPTLIATAIETALDTDADIGDGATGFFTVTRNEAVLTLTANLEAANDETMDVSIVTDSAVFGDEAAALAYTVTEAEAGVAPYVRTVEVKLETAEGDLHAWFSGEVPVTIGYVTGGDGAASLEDALGTSPVMENGVMQVPITLRGTWAGTDTNTLTVTEKTILGYTVSEETSIETSTDD